MCKKKLKLTNIKSKQHELKCKEKLKFVFKYMMSS